jgi:hypothetical protein
VIGYLRRHHLAFVALFVALGGTSYAAATIGSDDIKANAVLGRHIAADEVGPQDLKSIAFAKARTVRLTDAQGGGAATSELFAVGDTALLAVCNNGAGDAFAGIEPVAAADGPVLVLGDSAIPLHTDSVDFVIGLTVSDADGLSGRERSFGILDRDGTSATGVAAADVDPAAGRCVISAHAFG